MPPGPILSTHVDDLYEQALEISQMADGLDRAATTLVSQWKEAGVTGDDVSTLLRSLFQTDPSDTSQRVRLTARSIRTAWRAAEYPALQSEIYADHSMIENVASILVGSLNKGGWNEGRRLILLAQELFKLARDHNLPSTIETVTAIIDAAERQMGSNFKKILDSLRTCAQEAGAST